MPESSFPLPLKKQRMYFLHILCKYENEMYRIVTKSESEQIK